MCITQITKDFSIEICDDVMDQSGLRAGDVVAIEVTGPGRIELLGMRAVLDAPGGSTPDVRDERI